VFGSFGASPITRGMFGDKNVEKFAFDLRVKSRRTIIKVYCHLFNITLSGVQQQQQQQQHQQF
jgi:hypothetical protein